MPRKPKKEITYLTEQEVDAFFRVIRNARSSRKHGPINRRIVWVLMKRYCILAGIPPDKAHPHALKHSCVTRVAKLLNGNLIEIQDHVGNADPLSTMRSANSGGSLGRPNTSGNSPLARSAQASRKSAFTPAKGRSFLVSIFWRKFSPMAAWTAEP